MRLMAVSVTTLMFSTSAALSGGGTVTSTEPGPPALTTEATIQILSTVGIAPTPETVLVPVTYTPPAKAKVTYTPPAKAKVTYTPPAKVIHAPPPVAPAEQTKLATEVKTAETPAGPLNPREVIRQCSTCHGVDGIAKIPTAPNIAGSSRGYLETQLKAFRSGKRENEVMSVIAEDLSNAEIKAAAKWYASLKVTVEVPE